MKGGRQPHGFTIIEIMIFLAVSGVIFFSAMILMSGSQDKTEFNTAIAQVASQLQSIVGNVANGYYLSQQNFTCTPNLSPGSLPNISFSSVSQRGTSLGCTFLGEVIQFNPRPVLAYQQFVVYPVVGNQYYPPTNTPGPATLEADNLTEATPEVLYDSSVDQAFSLPYGITVHAQGMGFNDDSITHIPDNDTCQINSVPLACIGAIGFFTTFNGYKGSTGTGSSGFLQNGSQTVQVVPIPGSSLGQDPSALVNIDVDTLSNDTSGNNANDIKNNSGSIDTVSNPDEGVEICLDSGTDNESGLITIGGVNSPTAVTLQKYSQKGCK
jgi:type II secretory pathway pseudopilin PulG